MKTDRFLIAPFDKDSGLTKNYSPFLIPDEAFAELTNAYVDRGQVRKRFGTSWMSNTQLGSRFRMHIGTTDAKGGLGVAAKVPLKAGVPIATPAIGQMFSIGTEAFTVNKLGAPADVLRSGASTEAKFNATTGEFWVTGAEPLAKVYYYPALPVMGLRTYEAAARSSEILVGFDTRFAYYYAGGWERYTLETVAGDSYWSGSNTDFFWTCTWLGTDAYSKLLFTTNFNQLEARSMRYLNSSTWTTFRPAIDSGVAPNTLYLLCAQIIVPFKNRLVALNTWEGTLAAGIPNLQVNYQNRARYSQVGSPLEPNSWNQSIPGKGNAIDCPTTEAIISVEFIKDHLIVFFERSTWDLVYTGNQVYPFVWQQINAELGVESSFSVVQFDKVAIGVGNVGIHACNGSNVSRIDQKIPDEVFNIHNGNDGVFRVYGIRDYTVEMVYWTFPDNSRTTEKSYPNQVLVFNYETGTWSFNDDSITCFGYYQAPKGITWDSEKKWEESIPWSSGPMGALSRTVIGGNQQGYTFTIDSNNPVNAAVLQITDFTVTDTNATVTCIDHNLQADDFIYFQGITADATSDLVSLNDEILKITTITDGNNFKFTPPSWLATPGTYEGNGTISRVSSIKIKTKEFNFYASEGSNAYISKVDFLVDSTDSGEITVDYYLSTSRKAMGDSVVDGIELGSNILETFPYSTMEYEANGSLNRFWHPLYFSADGECIQLYFSMTDSQMKSTAIRSSDFVLHGMLFYAQRTSSRFQ